MDLILWRHAHAHEVAPGGDDLARLLTPQGERDALKMGEWLDRRLPRDARVLVSPAWRCVQTALALGREYESVPALQPGCSVDELLALARWPSARQPVLVVGHQPVLGQVLAQVLKMDSASCSVRKGAAWWVRGRQRDGRLQTVVFGVQTPDLVTGR